MRITLLLVGVCAAIGASPGDAAAVQDTVVVVERGARLDAGSRVAREAVDFFNNRAITRTFGTFTVSSNEVIRGDVAVYSGPVRIAGVIRGDLVVINADLRLSSTADIRGDILVVGGAVSGMDRARIDGNVRVYESWVAVRREGNELVLESASRRERRSRERPRFADAHASLNVWLGGTYNRVEGLPLHVGPRVEWRTLGRTHFRIEGQVIIRTAGDFETNRERYGYTAGAEWTIAGSPVTLGGRVYDMVVPIEDWQLQDEEIGLATLLWHRDYRDYYVRRGYLGFLRIEPTEELTLTGELARNEETSALARDPWTPFRSDELWRTNPLIDEGTFTSIRGILEWDSRPYRGSLASGWLVRAEWERGKSDDVTPQVLPPTVRDPLPVTGPYQYDRLFIDLRRYERIGWNGQLRLRAVGAGVIGNNDPLPIQRRLSLGGPDPMPGFEFRQFACNETVADPARPALCDRIVLFQAEFRGNLSLNPRSRGSRSRRSERRGRDHWFDQWNWGDWYWFAGPTIVLFGNAGTGWQHDIDDGPGKLQGDVGAGIEFGSFGVYGAKALTEGEPLRFSLRIHRRF
jgi:hypothetical protein